MKRMTLVFAALLCSQAFAQETTTFTTTTTMSAPATSSSVQAADVVMAAPQPQVTTPWHLTLGTENWAYEGDLREKGPMISYNFVGARYAPSKLWELELRQQFQIISSRERLSARNARLHEDSTTAMAETVLRAAYKPTGFLGSSAALLDLRYYAPTDRVAQDNHEMGRVRFDNYFEWAMNSKFTMAAYVSPRVQFNSDSNPNRAVGADAEYYQLKAAPYFIYTMNDHINPYYAYTLVEMSSQAQRGNWEPDMANVGAHELGLNIMYGAFYINPALISETNLEDGGGSLLSDDSRAFSYENISYNLNVYAVF